MGGKVGWGKRAKRWSRGGLGTNWEGARGGEGEDTEYYGNSGLKSAGGDAKG